MRRRRHQHVGHHRHAGDAAEGARQQGRLVVAPGEEPRPVQRHRRHQFGIGEQGAPGARHPSAERRRRVRAVSVLEGEDQLAAGGVVDHGRAGSAEGRTLAAAGAAGDALAGVELERHAAAPAQRRPDEADPLPAGRAQRAGHVDDGAAAQALGRQHGVEGAPRQPAQRRGGDPGEGVYGRAGLCHSATMNDAVAVFNRASVRRHRDRAAATIDAHGFLFAAVGERLADRLDDVKRRFPVALDLGCHGGELGRALRGRGGIETVIQCDLSPRMAARARRRGVPTLAADEELLPFAEASFDLILSCLSLHWVNDLPGALVQMRRALRPDGLLLAAMFGGGTLKELRAALAEAEIAVRGGLSPRVAPFADVRDAGDLLARAGFALPVADADTITVSYADPLTLMRELRGMGETNAVTERGKGFTRRAVLFEAAARYREAFGDAEGRVPCTFQVITMTAWAPHPSQPKALRPGSAEAGLADAL